MNLNNDNENEALVMEGNGTLVPHVLPNLPGPTNFIKNESQTLRRLCYGTVQVHRPHIHVRRQNREASPRWKSAMDTLFSDASITRNYSPWVGPERNNIKKYQALVKAGLKHDHGQYEIKSCNGSILHDCERLGHQLQNEIIATELENTTRLNETALEQANRQVLNNQYEAQMGLLPGVPGVEPPSLNFELDDNQRHALGVLPPNPGLQGKHREDYLYYYFH